MGILCSQARESRMPRPVAYIAVVYKSAVVADKITEKHKVRPWEVDEAVVLTQVEASWWDYDRDRGWRLMVIGTTAADRRLYVVLYPVDEPDGTWDLGTAMPAD